MSIPAPFEDALKLAHPSWRPHLRAGLAAVAAAQPEYLPTLAAGHYLPTENRLFAAFSLPIDAVRYVLVGEGPYPREQSATGVCFMDGAVKELWCDAGLAKPVNRAVSLRNFMKMLLVAAGQLDLNAANGEALAPFARQAKAGAAIATMPELQQNMTANGFLLLNAALVFRPAVAPAVEARAWLPFLQAVLHALAGQPAPPKLVLWGKIAEKLRKLPESERFEQVCSEHPFNVSFIGNRAMHALFAPMKLLEKPARDQAEDPQT